MMRCSGVVKVESSPTWIRMTRRSCCAKREHTKHQTPVASTKQVFIRRPNENPRARGSTSARPCAQSGLESIIRCVLSRLTTSSRAPSIISHACRQPGAGGNLDTRRADPRTIAHRPCCYSLSRARTTCKQTSRTCLSLRHHAPFAQPHGAHKNDPASVRLLARRVVHSVTHPIHQRLHSHTCHHLRHARASSPPRSTSICFARGPLRPPRAARPILVSPG